MSFYTCKLIFDFYFLPNTLIYCADPGAFPLAGG